MADHRPLDFGRLRAILVHRAGRPRLGADCWLKLMSVIHLELLAIPVNVLSAILPFNTVIAMKLCGASHRPDARTVPSSPTVPSILVAGLNKLIFTLPLEIVADVCPA